jgi:dethiobiotin synthetase
MSLACFITGTDTDVGKTLVSAALLYKCKSLSCSTVAMKPVAAGCEKTAQGLRNSDALTLQKFASIPLIYEQVNPLALEAAIAPHIAAQEQKLSLSVEHLKKPLQEILNRRADFTLIEGAGGWLVPLNKDETLADLARAFKLPVIMVVAIRLGCINHALLSARAIQADGLELVAWVANLVQGESDRYRENIASIQQRISAPLLATIPQLRQSHEDEKIIAASSYINDHVFKELLKRK